MEIKVGSKTFEDEYRKNDFDIRHRGGAVVFLAITAVLPQRFINAFPLPWSLPR